jgi:hypothetical protein
MWLDVNGERMQKGSTATMVFDVATIVSYVSRFMTLEPGDLIATGTPPGVGMGFKPPRYLGRRRDAPGRRGAWRAVPERRGLRRARWRNTNLGGFRRIQGRAGVPATSARVPNGNVFTQIVAVPHKASDQGNSFAVIPGVFARNQHSRFSSLGCVKYCSYMSAV